MILDTISAPIVKHPIDIDKYPLLQHLPLADPISPVLQEVEIDILIGEDYYEDFVMSEKYVLDQGLKLVASKFGYLLCGPIPDDASEFNYANAAVAMLRSTAEHFPGTQLETFWSLEDLGIKDSPYSNDDEAALRRFNDTIKFKDGRYEVTLPYKDPDVELPSNYGKAIGCLKSLCHRFRDKPEVLLECDKIVKDQLQKGVVEPVESVSTPHKLQYIPHHPVVKTSSTTTKTRMVFNASAKAGKSGRSLNDCLYRGPVFLQDLCGILVRFRLRPIGLTCDVEKAFLQVGLQESERDVCRFAWLKNPTRPPSDDNLLLLRFRRIPFGLVSSPFLLDATIKHHLLQSNTKCGSVINRSIYVDNVLLSVTSVDDAVTFFKDSREVFDGISMNLREWFTSSSEFREAIPEMLRGTKQDTKVLGLEWQTACDTLRCPGFVDVANSNPTKRTVLKSISSVFDPCGFFTPVTVRGKMLIQDIWKEGFDWDNPLPDVFRDRYAWLASDFARIGQIDIPRFHDQFLTDPSVTHQVHVFCDASKSAYSCPVFLRSSNSSGDVSTNLIFAKVRLAPLKVVTVPRLELMGVVIGVRAAKFILQELDLPIDKVYVWTDSKCVLHWLCSKKVLTVFVRNRINEIRSDNRLQFRYVPTDQNPADLPTRGVSLSQLETARCWWFGPDFLRLSETEWPANEFELPTDTDEEIETTELLVRAETKTRKGIGNVLDETRFSSLMKLLRITAYVFRFLRPRVSAFRLTPTVESSHTIACVPAVDLLSLGAKAAETGDSCDMTVESSATSITSDEVRIATIAWVKYVQQQFPFDLQNVPNALLNLKLFLDKLGLIRCRGRLANSDLPQQSREPILLPRDSWFTTLVFRFCHISLGHAGPDQTLSRVRFDYWIHRGKSVAKQIVARCPGCIRAHGGHCVVPPSPALPRFRVQRSLPFQHSGLDYFGPLLIRLTPAVVSSSQEKGIPAVDLSNAESQERPTAKIWICLFTCAVIRAVHLEVVLDNSVDQFLMALQRFCSIYGCPETITSDNAEQFKASNKILRKIHKDNKTLGYLTSNGINWHFIPALSPWMGGFYERLVGTVKRSMRKVLGSKCLTLVQLQTVFHEIAAIVNTRPLCNAESDVGVAALTPAHFLSKSGRLGLPPIIEQSDDEYLPSAKVDLAETWKKGQHILDEYWHVWSTDYLAALREKGTKEISNYNAKSPVALDMIVLIKKHRMPRVTWKMGRVIELRESKDGYVRSVTVKCANGKKLVRPVKLLYPIEQCTVNVGENVGKSSIEKDKPGQTLRKKRKAAIKATDRIREIATADDSDSE
jgi:hypothetical protein